MTEHNVTVAFDVFIESDASPGLGHDGCELGFPHSQGVASEVIPIQLNQIEGIEKNCVVMAAIANPIPFSSQDTASPSIMQERDRTGEVVTRTAIESHPLTIFPRDDPKAVVLYFVDPERA
jgi:hypothetical protein